MHRPFKDEDFLLPKNTLAPLDTYKESKTETSVKLLSEIEFLSRFWKGGNAYLVYVSSDLSSLPFLARLFPSIKFHAYSSRLESYNNLVYHKEEFSHELAKGWRNTRSIYTVYFISYHRDLEEQKLWHLTMEAKFSFLSLDVSVKDYLAGYLFVQPSEEKRVMLVPEEGEKSYLDLDGRMAYYQQKVRNRKFTVQGEVFSFDRAYEMQVFSDYTKKTKTSLDEVEELLKELSIS